MKEIAYHNAKRNSLPIALVLIAAPESSSSLCNEGNFLMPFEYLPIMAENSAPKPPRGLASPSEPAWCPIKKPVSDMRVALLSSAALRLENQEPFVPREDVSYRRVSSDPGAGTIIIDHHSGIGQVPKQDPEIVFPRTALVNLAAQDVIHSVAPFHFSFMGGLRQHQAVENELARALANELASAKVDLALLVPY
jgi:D-proline reductase (dithiol) PrdB